MLREPSKICFQPATRDASKVSTNLKRKSFAKKLGFSSGCGIGTGWVVHLLVYLVNEYHSFYFWLIFYFYLAAIWNVI
jgi:hypothetical protein